MERWSNGMEEGEAKGPGFLPITPILRYSNTPRPKECPI